MQLNDFIHRIETILQRPSLKMSVLERREAGRTQIEDCSIIKPCTLTINEKQKEVTLIDLSSKGAKIKGVELYTDQAVKLNLADGTERKSEVVWTLGDISGLIFLD